MQNPGHTMTTARLTLRPVTDQDATAIVGAIGDFEVLRWLSRAPFPYGVSDAQTFIAKNSEHPGSVWMIEDRARLVGCIGRRREFGYWLARGAWGQGYATEAGRAVLDLHFADPSAPGLLSGYHVGNTRSARVLHKLGFRAFEDRVVFAEAEQREVRVKGMRMERADYAAMRSAGAEAKHHG